MKKLLFISVLWSSLLSGAQPVTLEWLAKSSPAIAQAVSWGVPWQRGVVPRNTSFRLTDRKGQAVPVQSWPMAYWPDGSLKWTGHAAVAERGATGPFTLSVGATVQPAVPLEATQSADAIEIRMHSATYRIPRRGTSLVGSISVDGREIARDGKLIAIREDRSRSTEKIIREEDFTSLVESAVLERAGTVAAVVRLSGRHKADSGTRLWLPFTVRLYFSADSNDVRMVHSFVFDGDQTTDFIKGLGIRFNVPMRKDLQNRHVRLVGDTGMFAEPVRAVAARRIVSPELYDRQLAGREVPPLEQLPWKEMIPQLAVWNDFRLTQSSPDAFSIEKRTSARSGWVRAVSSGRSLGLAFAGDTSGGLAIGMRNFWQLAPTALEIENAGQTEAQMTAWLWSPDVPAMDLRPYDDKYHAGEATYEDWEPGYADAAGVARTSELTLRAYPDTPPDEDLLQASRQSAEPARLVCTPAYYHAAGAFGIWSLPDRSSSAKAHLESKLDQAIEFYQGQIQQRGWYGFWDYGDVMHSYDPNRHIWRYDLGALAWQQTEQMPDMWLWYAFLRSGRADIFRMAEAMTRNTQEVDVYHLGRFQGLGTRHNVRHWGDSAKEMRISQAALKRFYYYLTTDERTGDLMNEVIDSDERLLTVDAMRKEVPKSAYPTHIRVGPDWMAAAGNWFAAWERTEDPKYRDRIVTGMKNIAAMKGQLFSGIVHGYDPSDKTLYQLSDTPTVNVFVALMGGPELFMELNPVIDLPEWNETWLRFCRYAQASPNEQTKEIGAPIRNSTGWTYARMTAYAARALRDPKLAAQAWASVLKQDPPFVPRRYTGIDVINPVDESPKLVTNEAAQWCLSIIEMLELIGDQVPGNAAR